MKEKTTVLFLCTGNSCRSQMAEGFANHLRANDLIAYSAGIETHGLNENAVKVMAEENIDISNHKSQNIKEFLNKKIDFVITVCDNAKETCPIFPKNCKVLHASFQDPPKLAKEIEKNGGSKEMQLDCYRNVRDQIKEFIINLSFD